MPRLLQVKHALDFLSTKLMCKRVELSHQLERYRGSHDHSHEMLVTRWLVSVLRQTSRRARL